jgi:hypothetical protein
MLLLVSISEHRFIVYGLPYAYVSTLLGLAV